MWLRGEVSEGRVSYFEGQVHRADGMNTFPFSAAQTALHCLAYPLSLQVPSCIMFICKHLPVNPPVCTPSLAMLHKQSRDVPRAGPLQVPMIGIRKMCQAGVARKRHLRKLGTVAQEGPCTYCMRGASGARNSSCIKVSLNAGASCCTCPDIIDPRDNASNDPPTTRCPTRQRHSESAALLICSHDLPKAVTAQDES